MTNPSLIEFPCSFPVKIIGVSAPGFVDAIKQTTLNHFPKFTESDLTQKPSEKNNYLAVTVQVFAENQAMLDAFYQDITKLPGVKMVL